jgi:hypothetical protein
MPKPLHNAGLIGAALTATTLLLGCAHTAPAGKALVALGALTLGFGVLDAAGVLGSDCDEQRPMTGEAITSCSGNGIVPHAVDWMTIGAGAGLAAAGAVLWTSDNANPTNVAARRALDREIAAARWNLRSRSTHGQLSDKPVGAIPQ